ncbi:MAG: SO_0444 family Cu/Zn efflux transporter [Candidatus Cloacimonetes bacterium]|nr:SO_0444 family Cu/Zn efflux transporter [Candidatus Cloacimonadota bacterium]
MVSLLKAIYQMYLEIAPYLFIGLTFAGLMHILLKGDFIYKQLGKKNFWSILKAALFGVPLPLCSCGVIPTAMHLRRKGASKGATISFLTSTPQTGIDSIIPTIGMLGWFMGIYRPLTALIMGIITGAATNNIKEEEKLDKIKECASGCCIKCECNDPACPHPSHPWNRPVVKVKEHGHNHDHGHAPKGKGWLSSFISYAYGDFIDDISTQLTVGIIIAGLITWLIPEGFFLKYGGDGFLGMLFMIVVGLPMYVCATGSIPIAVSLMMKGISPGAAFVFLVVGPATNAASLTVIAGSLGKKITIVYVSVLTACALGFGYLLNFLKPHLVEEIRMNHGQHEMGRSIILDVITVLFTVVLLLSFWRKYRPRRKVAIKEIKTGDLMRRFIVNMHCNHCVKAVKSALEELPGVENLKVELEGNLVELTGAVTDESVITTIKNLGYEIEKTGENK